MKSTPTVYEPCILLMAAALFTNAAAQTDTFWTRDTLTGDWCGARDSLKERGIVTEFSTTGYSMRSRRGGMRISTTLRR